MKELKVVGQALKALGLKINPAVLLLIPILAVVVVKLLKARKKKADAAAANTDDMGFEIAESPAASLGAGMGEIKADTFVDVWKKFLTEVPSAFRRSMQQFKPVILLGNSGSGKTALVQEYTDWLRQSEQFFLGHSQDQHLQVYLGSRVVIHELSPGLLNNNGKQARTALSRLWKKLFRSNQPIPLVVVSAAEITTMTPDSMERLGKRIRGKLNTISWSRKGDHFVRIALTHMDKIDGYAEFSNFANQESIPLFLNPKIATEEGLTVAFREFESFLPLALERVSADEYKKIISFLRSAPSTFKQLARFIDQITCVESLSTQPSLETIYLTSRDHPSVMSNPFWVDPKSVKVDVTGPIRKHLIYASAIASLFSLGVVALYGHQRHQWYEAKESLVSLSMPHKVTDAPDLSPISRFTRSDNATTLSKLVPEFYTKAQNDIATKASDIILMQHLLPGFVDALNSNEPQLRSLYLLATIRASVNNELGYFILNNLEHWTKAVELPESILKIYIQNTPEPYSGSVATAKVPLDYRTTGIRDLENFRFLLTQLQDYSEAATSINPHQLETLQRDAETLLNQQRKSERFRFAESIVKFLENSPFRQDLKSYDPFLPQIRMTSLSEKARKPFRETLQLITQSRFLSKETTPHTIADLTKTLRLATEYPSARTPEPKAWDLQVQGKTFVIRNIDWFELMKRSRNREVLRDFVQWHRENDASIFFKDPDAYLPLVLNPSNNGKALFVGDQKIQGIYTKEAFETEIQPTVLMLNNTLEELTLDPKLQAALRLLVQRKLTTYADNYANQVAVFYNDFELRADSTEGLTVILKQILHPISPFKDFLQTIHENTALDIAPANEQLFAPIVQAMSRFQSFNRVMTLSADNTNEYQRYRTIIEELYATLTRPIAADEKPGETDIASLTTLLNPAALQALQSINNEAGTYIDLVEEWLDSVELAPDLRRPFLAPVYQMHLVGLSELEEVIEDLWTFEITPSFRPQLQKFPFDHSADEEVSPEELAGIFSPVDGSFHQLKDRFLSPVINYERGKFQAKPSRFRPINLPKGLLAVTTRIERLTNTLWDKDGNPTPLRLRVSPVPFEIRSSVGDKSVTLAYLGLGKESVVNINQKPFESILNLDWTTKQVAQVGVRITDKSNLKVLFPDPLITRDSYWSMYRLLRRSEQRKNTWSWLLKLDGVAQQFETSFEISENPWTIFEILSQKNKLAYEAR